VATRTDKITEILRGLRVSSPDIIGSAVCSLEGFIIASAMPAEIDEELVGGMSAALLGIGERISGELMRATMEQTFVKSEKGYVILNAVGTETVLVLLVSKEAKLGLIFLELKRAIPELSKVI
jgi:predicted regulator of Ras-like GTPase activity (Roadblock/LC7/MglB family)